MTIELIDFLFQLCGCGILGVGIWLRLSYAGYAQLLPRYSMISADSLCIAVGVIVFIVAFFGCCGSWFQSRCMLITVSWLVSGTARCEAGANTLQSKVIVQKSLFFKSSY